MKSGKYPSVSQHALTMRAVGILILITLAIVRVNIIAQTKQDDQTQIYVLVEQMLKSTETRNWNLFCELWADPTKFPDLAADRGALSSIFKKPFHIADLRFSLLKINSSIGSVRANFNAESVDPSTNQKQSIQNDVRVSVKK